MTQQSISVNQQQLDSLKQLLTSLRDQKMATRRAVKRTATGGRVLIAKRIGEKVTLKAAYIKQNVTVQVADVQGKISIYGNTIPLAKFSVYPGQTARRSKNGLTVKVFKDRPGQKLRHAFWGKMPTGHVGVFLRKIENGRPVKRLSIVEQRGITLTTLYERTPGLATELETEIAARLQRELDAQVQFILSRRQPPP